MIKKMHSLKSKLILFFIIIIGIVLILQIGISQYLISTIIVEKSGTYFQETINQIGKRVDLQIGQCEEMVLRITNNQVLRNYLKDLKHNKINYNIAKYKTTREILSLADLEMIDNIYIFTVRHPPINCYYSKAILEMDSYTRYLLYYNFTDSDKEILWAVLRPKPFEISLFSCIKDEKEILGLLRISFNETFLNSILDEAKLGKEGKVYLLNDENKIIFTKDRSLITESFSRIENVSGPTMKYPFSIVKYPLHYERWSLVGVVPETEIVNQITQFNRIFFLMVILILTSIMVFAIAAARAILRPLNRIMKGMECIQQGNLNVMLESDADDEFSIIIHNFNYMVERVKSLIETVYHQQVHYRKAEILALQAKLNPHFLYNTLDAIYWMLILKGEEEIGEVVVALSSILRYSISHENEFVTVREDMGQLENYLKIQRMRFEDKLEYDFHIQEEILELKIPKLLIQPLVENSIKYAFNDMKCHGVIGIRGYLEKEDLIFEVVDNGVGMSEEKIRSIFAGYEFQSKKSGIGIQLVHHRIRYIYGEGYGISIESTVGEGTKVTVRLRKKPEFNQEELLRA